MPGCDEPTQDTEAGKHPSSHPGQGQQQRATQPESLPALLSWTPLLPTLARLPWPGAVCTIWVKQHSKEGEILSTGGMITF